MRAVSADPDLTLVATLGSCVAIFLHDPQLNCGGMNHIFQCVDPGPLGGASVVAEVEALVNEMVHLGSSRRNMQCRIAGGARTLGRGRDHGGDIARVCLEYLAAEGLTLLEQDLGGTRPRRIAFKPVQGLLTISYPGSSLVVEEAPAAAQTNGAELF
ncbi:chemotaxis protein CheD [Jannaschia pohangensis]|nr:chemotaxis protein CheD [Jannaschia pohangensis]